MKTPFAATAAIVTAFSVFQSALAAPQVGLFGDGTRISFQRLEDERKVIVRFFAPEKSDRMLTDELMADPEGKGKDFVLRTVRMDEEKFRSKFNQELAALDADRLTASERDKLKKIQARSSLETQIAEQSSRETRARNAKARASRENADHGEAQKALVKELAEVKKKRAENPADSYYASREALLTERQAEYALKSARIAEDQSKAEQEEREAASALCGLRTSLGESEKALSDIEKIYEQMLLDHGGVFGLGAPQLQSSLTVSKDAETILFNVLNRVAASESSDPVAPAPAPKPVVRKVWKGEEGNDLNFRGAETFCRGQGLELPSREDFEQLAQDGKLADLTADARYWTSSKVKGFGSYFVFNQRTGKVLEQAKAPEGREKFSVRCVERPQASR
jgi:hypothetical protein